jgi:hypothetical protein
LWKKQFCKLFCATNLDKVNAEKAMALKYDHIPSALYKYRHFDKNGHSLNILKTDQLWISSPNSFNDPFDCGFTFNYGKPNQIDETIKKIVDDAYEKFLISDLNNTSKNRIFVISFSGKNDSLPMWSHYADNHKGFCIEYNFKQLNFENPVTRLLFPVIYNEKLFNATKHLRQGVENITKYNNLMNICAAINKSNEWSYEKEWRIVSIYNLESGLFSVQKPKAVYLGAKADDKFKKRVIKIAKNRDFNVYQMQIKASEYALEAKKIFDSK